MSNKTMWFGTLYETVPGTSSSSVKARMSLVPVPDPDIQMGSEGYAETLDFEYGGADVVSSAQSHRVYEMAWGARANEMSAGLDLIKRYSQRGFGPGLIYFADPFNYETNLLPPHWADPSLIEEGWRNIYDVDPTFAQTASNSYDQPLTTATWAVDGAPADKRGICVIPVHPLMTLHVGFSGAADGTAAVTVRPINTDGSYASTSALTLLDATTATRMNATFAGSSYKAVEIYFTGTGDLELTSGMAQLWATGTSPTLTGSFVPGQGNTGCRFESPAVPEEYRFAGNRMKGLAATLVEVGTAKRYAG